MAGHYFAELTEKHPEIAYEAFGRFDVALNTVLPGSNTHPRYLDVEEVGLAIVVGKSYPSLPYDPLDPTTIDRLSFIADNMTEHPGAWEPKVTDSEMLGATMPEGIGRFTVFALAKMNALTKSTGVNSYNIEKQTIAPGIVGLAGGQKIKRSFVATSGLWEVHDHVTTTLFVNEVCRAVESRSDVRTADDIAGDIELFFGRILSLQKGVPATELSRRRVFKLLGKANDMVFRHLDSIE